MKYIFTIILVLFALMAMCQTVQVNQKDSTVFKPSSRPSSALRVIGTVQPDSSIIPSFDTANVHPRAIGSETFFNGVQYIWDGSVWVAGGGSSPAETPFDGDYMYAAPPFYNAVFNGDSWTVGGNALPATTILKYSTQTSKLLNAIENNYAIGGTTMVQVTPGDSAAITRLWTTAHPNSTFRYFFVMYGINDAASDVDTSVFRTTYEQYLQSALDSGWDEGQIWVIGCGNPPISNRSEANSYSIAARNAALHKGVHFIELYNFMQSKCGNGGCYDIDSLHPTAYGHAIISEDIKEKMHSADTLTGEIVNNNGLINTNQLIVSTLRNGAQPAIFIKSDSASNNGIIQSYFATTGIPTISVLKSRGSFQTRTPVISGDALMSINSSGYDGTLYRNVSQLINRTTGTISSDNIANYWDFNMGSSSSALTSTLRIWSNHRVEMMSASTITAASSLAAAFSVKTNLTPTGNNQVLAGLDIQPTYNVGSFTGTAMYAIRGAGDFVPATTNAYDLGTSSLYFRNLYTTGIYLNNPSAGSVTDSVLMWRSSDKTVRASSYNSLFWTLAGNSGTDSTTKFIGTTDVKPLVFKTNGTQRGYFNSSTGNLVLNYSLGFASDGTALYGASGNQHGMYFRGTGSVLGWQYSGSSILEFQNLGILMRSNSGISFSAGSPILQSGDAQILRVSSGILGLSSDNTLGFNNGAGSLVLSATGLGKTSISGGYIIDASTGVAIAYGGTVSTTNASNVVGGSSDTYFTKTLRVGDTIQIGTRKRAVATIVSDMSLTTTTNWDTTIILGNTRYTNATRIGTELFSLYQNGMLQYKDPPTGVAGTDSVMVWDATTKTIKKISPTYYGTGGGGGSGTVTSVGFTGGLISVATPTTTPAFTVAGTSGGIPYFSSSSTWASSGALTANSLVIGGGAGVAPSTTTTGTGVLTALGINTGSAGAFVTNNAANTFTAIQAIQSTTANQFYSGYDGSNGLTFNTTSGGATTLTNSGAFTLTTTGAMTVTGGSAVTVSSGVRTNATSDNSNLQVQTSNSASATTSTASLLISPATGANFRRGMRGSSGTTLTVGNDYYGTIFGQEAVTEAASGTHNIVATAVFKPLSLTNGSATTTNTATVYIQDAATGGTNNYPLWVAAGTTRLDGGVQIGSSGNAVTASYSGSATLDFASTGAGAVADLTVTCTGAAVGDVVLLGVPNGSVTATATFTAWVSATNTVTVRFSPKATEDPASGTFKVRVVQ